MTSEMTDQPNLDQGTLGLMEDLAELLRAEDFPTHPPLIQLIDQISEDPTLKQVDLSYKYTRLAAMVGGDWIAVREELRSVTRFGALAFYCSISAMLAVFTCCRSRSHKELVSSLKELHNHITVGNEALIKRIDNTITSKEHANIDEASIANLNELVDIALTTIDKQTEHTKIAEARIANIAEQAENAVTAIGKQVEQVNKAEASVAKLIQRADHATTTMEKQANKSETSISYIIDRAVHATTTMEKQVSKAEASISNIIERADHSTTTMEKQINKAEESIANIIERADHAITTMEKQVNKAEATIANITERADNAINTNVSESITPPTASESPTEEFRQGNVNVVAIPGTKFRCEYGTVTITNQSKFVTNGSLEGKKLAMWFTLPVPIDYQTKIMNRDHNQLISLTTAKNISSLNKVRRDCNIAERKQFVDNFLANISLKAGQWSYIG